MSVSLFKALSGPAPTRVVPLPARSDTPAEAPRKKTSVRVISVTGVPVSRKDLATQDA